MILNHDKINRIKKILKSRPKGLTISDISQMLRINRNSAAKYLEILLITGQVEMRQYGNAKVYYISRRVPVSTILKFSTEFILMLDEEMRIVEVNDNFLTYFSLTREDLLVKTLADVSLPIDLLPANPEEEEFFEDYTREITFIHDEEEKHLKVKAVRTVFDNGSGGVILIMEDVTLQRQYERTLKMSEARYRAIVEDQTEFIVRYSPDFCLTFVNGAICQYCGISREDLEGRSFLDFIIEEDRDRVVRNILSLNRDSPFQTHEQRITLRDGTLRWHQWTNRAIFDEEGRILEYQGVGRDITDKKLAERDLFVRNQAIASSLNGIGIADLEGKVTYANHAFLKMFGYERMEDVISLRLEDFAYDNPENLNTLLEVKSGLMEKGEWMGEVRFHGKDGTPKYSYLSANEVRDECQNPLCLMASFIDLMPKAEAEREITMKNTIFDTAVHGIAIFDTSDRLIYSNQAFKQLVRSLNMEDVKHLQHEAILKMLDTLVPPITEIRRELRERGKWSGEICFNNGDGSQHFFQAAVSLIKDEKGRIVHKIGMIMDTADLDSMIGFKQHL